MRTLYQIKIFSIIAILTTTFCCCSDAKKDALKGDHVYIAYQGTDNAERYTVPEEGMTLNVQVRSNNKLTKNLKVNLALDEEALKMYNKRNGTSYVLLPSEFYTFDHLYTEIEEGSSLASPLNIDLLPLSPELGKSGLVYALPITVESVDNNAASILDYKSSILYVITPVPYTDVPKMSRANGMKMKLANTTVTLNDFTIEFLVKVDGLGLRRNNQIAFSAFDFSANAGGTGGEIFTRFAADGAAGSWDKFQIKNQGQNFDATFSFKNNVWYHIACVNDNATGEMLIYVNGTLDSRFASPGKSTTISSDRGVRFCGESDNDSYMRSNMHGGEIRLWSVARSAAQIKNNMYGIDPKTPGLVAYWKANDKEGAVIKDVTENGHDATLFGTPSWVLDEKVEVGQ